MAESSLSQEKASGETLNNTLDEVTSPTVASPPRTKVREYRFWPDRWTGLAVAAAFSIGSGNVWHFPALCLKHGGGLFLVQFVLCFVLAAVPLLLLETGLGQFSSLSPLFLIGAITPVMKGLAGSMICILVLRYNTLAVWATHSVAFLGHSIAGIWTEIPWSSCASQDDTCYDYRLTEECTYASWNSSSCSRFQRALVSSRATLTRKTPFVHFAAHGILKSPSLISELTFPATSSVVSFLIVWMLVGGAAAFGKRVLQRTAWVAIVIPTVVFIAMIGIGASLDSASDGLEFLMVKDASTLNDLEAWTDAAAQAVLALNLGCGGMLLISSLRGFGSPLRVDVLVVSAFSLVFSIIVTVTAFLYIGHLAALLYPEELPDERIRLLIEGEMYIQAVFPEILANLSVPWLLCSLYFLSQFLLAAQTMMTSLWAVVTILGDGLVGRVFKKFTLMVNVGLLSVAGLICGFLFITPGGLGQLFVVDQYVSYATLTVAFLEVVIVSYLYGFRRFSVNIRTMVSGSGPLNAYWWINWVVLTPLILLSCIVLAVVSAIMEPSYLPGSLLLTGWLLFVICLLPLILYGCIYNISRERQHGHWKCLIRPSGTWGPALPEDRETATRMERALRVR